MRARTTIPIILLIIAVLASLPALLADRAPRIVAIGYAGVASRSEDSAGAEGVRIAVEQLRAEARGHGYEFVIRRAPDDSDPVRAIAALRADPSVVAVVAHTWSQDVLDAASEYSANRPGLEQPLVGIAPYATNMDLSGLSPWIFRLCITDSQEAVRAAQFAFDTLHSRRAALLYLNDAFGRDWVRSFADRFQALGGTIVIREPVAPAESDWSMYVEYVQASDPDLIVVPAVYASTVHQLHELRAAGIQAPFLHGDGAPAYISIEDDSVPANTYSILLFDYRQPRREAVRLYVRALHGRHERPSGLAAYSHDAALTLMRGVLAVGPDRARVRDFLEELGRQRPPINGVTGPIAFDSRHDVMNPSMWIRRW